MSGIGDAFHHFVRWVKGGDAAQPPDEAPSKQPAERPPETPQVRVRYLRGPRRGEGPFQDADYYTVPPAAPAAAGSPLARAPAVRFAAPRDLDPGMVNHLEVRAGSAEVPDGTITWGDNTAHWIAEFVVRTFNPQTYPEGERMLGLVIAAYVYGMWHSAVFANFGLRGYERLTRPAVRAALGGLTSDVFQDAERMKRRMDEGINAVLSRGSVALFETIAQGPLLPGLGARDVADRLQARVAAYVVFRLKTYWLEDARTLAEGIVGIRNALVDDLQSVGMDRGPAQYFANQVMIDGLDMNKKETFTTARARSLLQAVAKHELFLLWKMGPRERRDNTIQTGDTNVNAQVLYVQLDAVYRRMEAQAAAGAPAAQAVSFGGVEDAGEPAAAAAGDAGASSDAAADADAAPVLGAADAGATVDPVLTVPAVPPSTPVR